MDRAIIIEPQEKVGDGAPSELSKQQARQIRRTVDLLKGSLQGRAERVVRQPAQRNVVRGAGESLGTAQLNGNHAEPLDIAGMSDSPHRDAVINLEDLL